MRFRKTLTSLILANALVFALSARASVGPSGAGPRPNAVRPYVACAAVLAPPAVPQELVAPGFSPASAALKGGATLSIQFLDTTLAWHRGPRPSAHKR